ncbi:MAG: hypothetical protein QOJ22_968, partial [Thermoleophilaceae bacterium]|nr:hypothetical protein [Thermoleophilaceae bacterium]
ATDSLGARSADAQLEVTVGPDVDRPPECTPSSYMAADPIPIWSRPGAVRRFAIGCRDPDGDQFTASLTSPPQRGTLALVEPPDTQYGYWGGERWMDATYVPVDSGLEPDPFTVTASGPRGDGPPGRMAIVPRALPENGGGGCGWSPANVPVGVGGLASVSCSDDDGDPLSAELVSEPLHGTAAPAVVTPGRYGSSDITIPYVPDPGYEGYDCVKVKVTDGNGLVFEIAIDIWVRPAPPPPPSFIPPLPTLPTLPPLPPNPSAG